MLISIKQDKKVVKISGKRYDPHNVEAETFTGLTKFNKQYVKKIGKNQPKCL